MHPAVVQLLVDEGADINSEGHDGLTPLHRDSTNGHPAVVQLLINNNTNISIKNESGSTSLQTSSIYRT